MLGIYSYIDKQTNDIVYVGKDSNIDKEKRNKAHFQSSRYNKQPINRILQNNPNRYTYQVLAWNVTDPDTLNALEIQYISLLKPKFNFTMGGDGVSKGNESPMKGKSHSEETKMKISETKKGNSPAWNKGTKGIMKSWNKGKELSEDHRNNLSKSHNTSGYFRVSVCKNKRMKKGIQYVYAYYEDGNQKQLASVNLDKLKEKVIANGLEWRCINEQ